MEPGGHFNQMTHAALLYTLRYKAVFISADNVPPTTLLCSTAHLQTIPQTNADTATAAAAASRIEFQKLHLPPVAPEASVTLRGRLSSSLPCAELGLLGETSRSLGIKYEHTLYSHNNNKAFPCGRLDCNVLLCFQTIRLYRNL